MGSFKKNFLILTSGMLSGRILFFFLAPIVTRLYSPNDFGILAIFASMRYMIVVIGSLKYENAIPLPEEDDKADALFLISLAIIFVFTISLMLVVHFFNASIAQLFNAPNISAYLWILPILFLFSSIHQAASYLFIRRKDFKKISMSHLGQSLAAISSKIAFGAFGVGAIGLIFSELLGWLSADAILLYRLLRNKISHFMQIKLKSITEAAIRYRKFPALSSISSLISSVCSNIAPLLLAAFFNPGISGLFLLAQQVTRMPIRIFGRSLSQIYLGEISRLQKDKKQLRRIYFKLLKVLLISASIYFSIILVFARRYFGLIFGKEWVEAGVYVQYLSIMAIAQFAISPLSQILIVLEKQAWQLLWEIFRIITAAATLFFAYTQKVRPENTIQYYCIVMAFSYVILFLMHQVALQGNRNETSI